MSLFGRLECLDLDNASKTLCGLILYSSMRFCVIGCSQSRTSQANNRYLVHAKQIPKVFSLLNDIILRKNEKLPLVSSQGIRTNLGQEQNQKIARENKGHPRILKGIVYGKRTLGRWYIDTSCILEQSSNVYIPVKYKEVSILSHGPMQHISIWRQFELHTICISQGTTNIIHTNITDMVTLHIDSLYKHLLCKHTTPSAPASTVCSEVYGQSLQTCVAYRHEQEVTFIQELSHPAIRMALEHIEPSNGSNRRSLTLESWPLGGRSLLFFRGPKC